jgi:hypothetical protein
MRNLIATIICAAVMALSFALPASALLSANVLAANALSLNGLSATAGLNSSQVIGVEFPRR